MASQWPPKKNTAFTLYFTLYKSDGTVIANPGTYTKKVSIDGAAVADIAASVTEEDTTYGQLSVVLSTSEMNGDAIWVYIKDDTSGCVPFTATLYTAAQTLDEVKTETAAVKAKTDNLPASPAAVGSNMGTVSSVTGAVGSVTSGVTVTTNNDKTGYSLSTAPPTAAQVRAEMDSNSVKLANLDAAVSTRSTYAGADTSGTATLLSRIAGTLAAGTHNPQTGDAYARIGAAGAGLTAVGDTRLANLDATISSRSTFAGGAVASVTGNVGGNVVGSVASVTAPVTAGTVSDKTGYELSSTGVAAIWAYVVEGSISAVQAVRGLMASAFGKLSGAATSTVTIRNASDTKDTITATVDADGNRSAVTKDLS
jgi:hypothetical protein